jgi:hypothetical protein
VRENESKESERRKGKMGISLRKQLKKLAEVGKSRQCMPAHTNTIQYNNNATTRTTAVVIDIRQW